MSTEPLGLDIVNTILENNSYRSINIPKYTLYELNFNEINSLEDVKQVLREMKIIISSCEKIDSRVWKEIDKIN